MRGTPAPRVVYVTVYSRAGLATAMGQSSTFCLQAFVAVFVPCSNLIDHSGWARPIMQNIHPVCHSSRLLSVSVVTVRPPGISFFRLYLCW